MFSTQHRKLNLYPEFKTNEGINSVNDYITSLHKGVEPMYQKSLNTRQMNRYDEKFADDFSTKNNELFYTPRVENDKKQQRFFNLTCCPS